MTKELKLTMRGYNSVYTENGEERYHTNAKDNNRAELLDLLEKQDNVILEVELPHQLGRLTIDCSRGYGDNKIIASFDKDSSLLLTTCELLCKMMKVVPEQLTRDEFDDIWEIFAHTTKSNNIADGLPQKKDELNGDRMDSRESERLCRLIREG